ncbi:uncharacterized protein LOC111021153 [Momordica charantia]|uniref:Uncharacterized protein LOC111021153 n=1 Tax=Momordica charantia TaxID=3673 RepID=A0A6J1DLH2_MOMCH|nr:uncharacterized protein LOC111021153 [Momordica charantia]
MAALFFIHPINFNLYSFMGTLNLLLRKFLEHGNFSHFFSHNWPFFWPSDVINILFLFCYSIVSTTAVAHTVAAVYTGQEPSPKGTTSLVAFLVYNIIAGIVLFFIIWTTIMKHGPFGEVNGSILAVFLVFYFVGLLYLVVVLQLSGVVSVFEESCGFKAMAKSRLLLKGKAAAAATIVDDFLAMDDCIDACVGELVVGVLGFGVLVMEARVGDGAVFGL